MPGYDQTGPTGSGPMTGGRRGRCTNTVDTTQVGRGQGRGVGRGQGRGQGRGLGQGRGPWVEENRPSGFWGRWRSVKRPLAFEEPIPDTQAALEAEAKRLKGELEYVESLITKSGTKTTEQ